MAAVVAGRGERRRGRRVQADQSPWKADALLRPGLLVRLINIGPHGVLVECPVRLRPGRRAELQLSASDAEHRHSVAGRVERCHVVRLDPLRFQGAIAFDEGAALPMTQVDGPVDG